MTPIHEPSRRAAESGRQLGASPPGGRPSRLGIHHTPLEGETP